MGTTRVSVPFRGSCFEIKSVDQQRVKETFPSPFGVRVLKFDTRARKANIRLVSVPFRGSCFEMDEAREALEEANSLFPSPFGVRVLKCIAPCIVRSAG